MDREISLHIHAILGVLVFITGCLQILLKKSGVTHRVIGQVYLYSWLFILISGAYLGGPTMTIVGLFGFYFALTGARIGRLKTKGPAKFEKIIFSIGVLISLAMLGYSVALYMKGNTSFSTVFGVFGLIFLFTTVSDIFKYILHKPLKKQIYGKQDWYFEHIIRMSISFIAAVTAFASIQNVFQNNTVNFLLPTLIGVILISLAIKSYKKKLLK